MTHNCPICIFTRIRLITSGFPGYEQILSGSPTFMPCSFSGLPHLCQGGEYPPQVQKHLQDTAALAPPQQEERKRLGLPALSPEPLDVPPPSHVQRRDCFSSGERGGRIWGKGGLISPSPQALGRTGKCWAAAEQAAEGSQVPARATSCCQVGLAPPGTRATR